MNKKVYTSKFSDITYISQCDACFKTDTLTFYCVGYHAKKREYVAKLCTSCKKDQERLNLMISWFEL